MIRPMKSFRCLVVVSLLTSSLCGFLPAVVMAESDATTISRSPVKYCLTTFGQLLSAVNQFIADGCSDTNNCNNEIVQRYGWPMGRWCFAPSITDMSELFFGQYNFNDDISSWYVSVTRMNLSSWDVSSVTNMRGMFWGASSFNQDLSPWNVSSVTNMESMFEDASSFNQDLSSWDVSSVTQKSRMFEGATSFDISAICCWNNGWQELFGCGGQSQCSSESSSSSPQQDPYDGGLNKAPKADKAPKAAKKAKAPSTARGTKLTASKAPRR